MEDFYNAGGLAALLNRLRDLLNLDCHTVGGDTLGEQIDGSEVIDDEVIPAARQPGLRIRWNVRTSRQLGSQGMCD